VLAISSLHILEIYGFRGKHLSRTAVEVLKSEDTSTFEGALYEKACQLKNFFDHS
jgi:hypothetical protein